MAEDIMADFALGVSLVIRDNQRRVKEDLFALGLGDAMFDKVFLIISFIPLKPGAAKEDFVGIVHP